MSTVSAQQTLSTATAVTSTPLDFNEILAHKVAAAVTGYRAKHPNATELQVAEFRLVVSQSMLEAVASKTTTAETKERQVRRTALARTVADFGINFRKLRSSVMAASKKPEAFEFVDEKGRQCVEVHTTLIEQASHLGGSTFAFIVKDDVATVAVAVCRDDENYDRLVGKEIAVERLLTGHTVTFPITDQSVFHEDFSAVGEDYLNGQQQLESLAIAYAQQHLQSK
jgi:hypothetical protein